MFDANAPDEVIDQLREEEDNRCRFSRLKLLAKSPAHYNAYVDTGTSAKAKGSAVHAVLTGQRVCYYDKLTDAGKSAPRRGKEWEAFRSANQDALILSRDEYADVKGMTDALRANKGAMDLIGGICEQTLSFDLMNVACRTTPDARTPGKFFTELKTCQSSDPRRFANQSFWMFYHAQMALHRIGIQRTQKEAPGDGYIVAVESTAPYPVTIFKMTEKALEAGEKQIRRWMETLKVCRSSNQWPPYSQAVVDLDIADPGAGLVFADDQEGLPF